MSGGSVGANQAKKLHQTPHAKRRLRSRLFAFIWHERFPNLNSFVATTFQVLGVLVTVIFGYLALPASVNDKKSTESRDLFGEGGGTMRHQTPEASNKYSPTTQGSTNSIPLEKTRPSLQSATPAFTATPETSGAGSNTVESNKGLAHADTASNPEPAPLSPVGSMPLTPKPQSHFEARNGAVLPEVSEIAKLQTYFRRKLDSKPEIERSLGFLSLSITDLYRETRSEGIGVCHFGAAIAVGSSFVLVPLNYEKLAFDKKGSMDADELEQAACHIVIDAIVDKIVLRLSENPQTLH